MTNPITVNGKTVIIAMVERITCKRKMPNETEYTAFSYKGPIPDVGVLRENPVFGRRLAFYVGELPQLFYVNLPVHMVPTEITCVIVQPASSFYNKVKDPEATFNAEDSGWLRVEPNISAMLDMVIEEFVQNALLDEDDGDEEEEEERPIKKPIKSLEEPIKESDNMKKYRIIIEGLDDFAQTLDDTPKTTKSKKKFARFLQELEMLIEDF
jgi:hypothetical protein